jgi:hypothetical protein
MKNVNEKIQAETEISTLMLIVRYAKPDFNLGTCFSVVSIGNLCVRAGQ